MFHCRKYQDGTIGTPYQTVSTYRIALTVIAGLLVLFGVLGYLFGEYLVAGVCFLLTSMTLYLREKQS